MSTLSWTCKSCKGLLRKRASRNLGSGAKREISHDSQFFRISEEVRQALSKKRPVVALESTIYTHGFPYPDNLALAARLESLVRVNGGVPATIGVLDGVARVGLGADELVRLVSSSGSQNTLKVSRRDLAFALGLKDAEGKPFHGGTTVAGTMILAHLAGIRIFATGGLGGVHRGAEQTMDVSADLTELGRTPVAVISSGCKSFLDIAKTLEYLETQGVAVGTFLDGRTGRIDFPAFYTRDSGIESPMVLKDEKDAANLLHAHITLGLQSGLLLANPIPEPYSIPLEQMEVAIGQALQEATASGATGAASTPYILSKIKELTGSKSVEANAALVEANVIRGTRIAAALCDLENPAEPSGGMRFAAVLRAGDRSAVVKKDDGTMISSKKVKERSPAAVFVAGSLAVDLSCDYSPRRALSSNDPELHTSNPAQIAQSLGGVGYNVARAAHLMGASVHLCSAVGDDLAGKTAMEAMSAAGMSQAGIRTLPSSSSARTAQYVAVNDARKDLVVAMADMSILERQQGQQDTILETFNEFWDPQIRQDRPSHLVLDGNWQPNYLARWLQVGKEVGSQILFEPVSTVKGAGLFQLPDTDPLAVFPKSTVDIATPNAHELTSMYMTARERGFFDRNDWFEIIDAFGIPHSGARTQMALATSSDLVDQGIPQQSIQLLPFIPTICTKLGSQGVLLTQIIPADDDRLTSGEYAPHILSRCANGSEDKVGVGGIYMRLFPSVEKVKEEDMVSVNGVGDTFAGTLIAGLAKGASGTKVEDLVDIAQRAAVLTLRSSEAVSPGLGTLRMLL